MRKTILTLFLATLCAATSYGQTMKALAYNTTNGVVTYNSTNNLTFTTSANFTADVFASAFETGSGTNFTQLTPDGLQFGHAGIAAATRTNLSLGATWLTNTNVTNFRSAIGLPLPALTNTSNVTTMRALAGTTNTNQPFSGTVEFQNHTADPFFMEISNGIILRIYE
jgi:hypothetical protein